MSRRVVPILPALSLRNRVTLERLYRREQLSAREICRLPGASGSGVLKALDRFSIPGEKDRPTRTGHLSFGFDYINHYGLVLGPERANNVQTRRNIRVAALSWEEARDIAAGRRESLVQAGTGDRANTPNLKSGKAPASLK